MIRNVDGVSHGDDRLGQRYTLHFSRDEVARQSVDM
jgi:hypothetical protein